MLEDLGFVLILNDGERIYKYCLYDFREMLFGRFFESDDYIFVVVLGYLFIYVIKFYRKVNIKWSKDVVEKGYKRKVGVINNKFYWFSIVKCMVCLVDVYFKGDVCIYDVCSFFLISLLFVVCRLIVCYWKIWFNFNLW